MVSALVLASILSSAPTPRVEDLGWLAGYWLDCSGGREASETWSDPRAGLMVGHAVTVRDGRASFEALHIRIGADDRLVYVAQPGGAAPVAFALADLEDGVAVFANPDHDFPQRIVYRRDGRRLTARVEGEIDGRTRSLEWRFEAAELNARCPG